MTPEQLANMKKFFGINDKFDLESIVQSTQRMGTESLYTSKMCSTEVNTNDLEDLNSEQEDEKLE
jgi:hypothetical protein